MTGIWAFIRSKLFVMLVAGGVAGVALTAAYATVVDYTNTLGFCAHTCHEMESTVYQEYMESRHFRNEQGVVVTCSQCHVPHGSWLGTFVRKAQATFELWGHFTGSINTPEKFEARRMALAQRVWAGFEADNARECRSCHAYANMIMDEQRPSVRIEHTDAMSTDRNCIDCHRGITHHLPREVQQQQSEPESFDIN